ncbi:hypothetical protein ACDH70_21950 [Xanthomonas axonopodis pv. poinsettiicola]|uniref:hypothetical protein n=1 Tax=Xanthomonas TaxID=338 RepID=UPI001E4C3515|nr:hypothetical protein [Xanthomonas codiaei]MCC8538905.1 hypothetical protein [Xanthomonas codiaei]
MSNVNDEAIFSMQVIIDHEVCSKSSLLRYLEERGLFDVDAPINGLYLPNDPMFAQELGCACFSSNPIPAYKEGMLGELQRIELSPDGQTMMAGDATSAQRVVDAVTRLQATIKVALINGDLVLA